MGNKITIILILFVLRLSGQCDTVLYDESQTIWVDNWYQTTGTAEAWNLATTGQFQAAIDSCLMKLDAEAYLIKSVSYASIGNQDSTKKYIDLAYFNGIPFERLMLFDSLRNTIRYQELYDSLQIKLISHFVGYVSSNIAVIWYRSGTDGSTMLFIDGKILTQFTSFGNSGQFWVTDLQANRSYDYEIKVNGKTQGSGSFNTMPEESDSFSIVVAGCSQYIPWRFHGIEAIGSIDPIAVFWLGDNIYADNRENDYLRTVLYERWKTNCQWKGVSQNRSTLAIWSDHDFSTDNDIGRALKFSPEWKYNNWINFRSNWANPCFGEGYRNPGVWFEHQIADVDFFFLDTRYYAEISDTTDSIAPFPSKLGSLQVSRLQNWLSSSVATFKVIVSSDEWTDYLPGVDAWVGYQQERDSLIFQHIIDNNIDGVIFVGGDRHRSDHFRIDDYFGAGYDFEEFSSSGISAGTMSPIDLNAIFSYATNRSFGLLSFNTTLPDPSVTYRIIDENGVERYIYTTSLSKLSY